MNPIKIYWPEKEINEAQNNIKHRSSKISKRVKSKKKIALIKNKSFQ